MKRQVLIDIGFLFSAGFIADQAGSYVLAFYIAGSIGIFFACLPFILLWLKRKTKSEDLKPINESEEDTAPVVEA